MNLDPRSGSEWTTMAPPWLRTMEKAVARPRPLLPFLVVKKGSKMLSRVTHPGYPLPVSTDLDPNETTGLEGRDIPLGEVDVVAGDRDRAAPGHGLDRVDDQVLDHLGDLPLVDLDRPEIGVRSTVVVAVAAAGGGRRRLLDQPTDGGDLSDRSPALGKGEQLLRQARGAKTDLLGLVESAKGFLRAPRRIVFARLMLLRIAMSMLLKSWAMPPARTPRLSSFWLCCELEFDPAAVLFGAISIGDVDGDPLDEFAVVVGRRRSVRRSAEWSPGRHSASIMVNSRLWTLASEGEFLEKALDLLGRPWRARRWIVR